MKRIYGTILISFLATFFVALFVYTAIKYKESNVNSFWNKTNITIMNSSERELIKDYQIRSDISEFKYKVNITHRSEERRVGKEC